MLLASVADVHLGNHRRFGGGVQASINRRCRATLDTLSNAVDRAIKREADTFLVAGDLFDYARPEAPLIAEVQRIFSKAYKARMQVVLLVGNHDQVSTTPNDHALAPLGYYAVPIERPRMFFRGKGHDIITVPFMPGPAREWLRKAVEATVNNITTAERHEYPLLLSIHLGVKDDKTPPWLASANDSIDIELLKEICFDHNISHVIAGNWHNRQQWTATRGNKTLHVLQLGALVPTGWDNPGLYGYGTIGFWDGKKLKIEELPGPRFLKVSSDEELQTYVDENEDAKCALFVSQVCLPDEVPASLARLQARAKANEITDAFEVLPDRSFAKAEARTAAEKARSAQTLAEALDVYVKRIPIEDGVSRSNVLQRCKDYLR